MVQSSASEDLRLTAFGGEFGDSAMEAAFRADRLAEAKRMARLLFALSAVFNAFFLLSDWRFEGTSHFVVALSARFGVILISLCCLVAAHLTRSVRELDLVATLWQWMVGAGVAVLVGTRSELALFVVVLLPTVYYLTVPLPFWLCLVNGIGLSILLLTGYLDLAQPWRLSLGLIVAVAMLNAAMMIVVSRANRLDRRQWAAVTAARRANARLRESENLLEKTFQAVPLPLLVSALADGRVLKCNEAALRFYGASQEQAAHLKTTDIYSTGDQRAHLLRRLDGEGVVTDFPSSIRIGDGSRRDVLVAASLIELGGTPGMVAAVIDITERAAVEQQVRYAATHDILTGLPNRAAFQARLEADLRTRGPDQGVCLLLIDLDGLKDVNDSLGHDAGDVALAETARRLQVLAGATGMVARLGGDEFVLLLAAPAAMEEGRKLGLHILADLRRPVSYQGRQLSIKASVGVAACPEHDGSSGELMKDADLALYAAKQQGRNRLMIYAPSMRQAVSERVTLLRDIMDALAGDQIEPFYQPKVSLVTGRLAGFEALVRWRRSPHVVLAPAAFELALTDREVGVLIGERMLRRVVSDVRNWIEAGYDCGRIAVNLSPAEFTHRDLAMKLLRQFHAAGIAADRFDVEITETVFLGRNSDHVAPILDELYRAGVNVALDDFGTGYAGLIHLKQLPIDTIKIDRGFVKDIEQDAFDTAIVCAVIELGRNLGMRVIAEGVETAGQARFLRERGCEFAQGFLFCRPLQSDDVPAFLRAENERTARGRLDLFL
ncbi:putative bifunctional diguanylate cyclase/phosphodiesterase [Xanthobacter agilis]|uniref:Diguanylate cyclase (GGDEF)-like protein/PAS domain S-box-containing protein n=1 Tax=Xanthobacter agilis TaxID=47492 RepID=A0ABU0L996_XANAG|nr:EAL domain-containing protein [Xanthobacter agilis]MDQ0503657.1 diguanylate cyclase (GGDEF)-like protein/PAS domain S-box-containing protein [Xanthobacter agilis]